MTKTNLPVILLRGIVVLPYAELKIDLMDELDTIPSFLTEEDINKELYSKIVDVIK